MGGGGTRIEELTTREALGYVVGHMIHRELTGDTNGAEGDQRRTEDKTHQGLERAHMMTKTLLRLGLDEKPTEMMMTAVQTYHRCSGSGDRNGPLFPIQQTITASHRRRFAGVALFDTRGEAATAPPDARSPDPRRTP